MNIATKAELDFETMLDNVSGSVTSITECNNQIAALKESAAQYNYAVDIMKSATESVQCGELSMNEFQGIIKVAQESILEPAKEVLEYYLEKVDVSSIDDNDEPKTAQEVVFNNPFKKKQNWFQRNANTLKKVGAGVAGAAVAGAGAHYAYNHNDKVKNAVDKSVANAKGVISNVQSHLPGNKDAKAATKPATQNAAAAQNGESAAESLFPTSEIISFYGMTITESLNAMLDQKNFLLSQVESNDNLQKYTMESLTNFCADCREMLNGSAYESAIPGFDQEAMNEDFDLNEGKDEFKKFVKGDDVEDEDPENEGDDSWEDEELADDED